MSKQEICPPSVPMPAAGSAAMGGVLLSTLARRLMTAVLNAIARWQERRKLETISDHLLKDIGLTRADIYSTGRWRD